MTHPLLKITRRQSSSHSPDMPLGSTYDAVAGTWYLRSKLLARDPRMALATKKKDVETGEDVKGI